MRPIPSFAAVLSLAAMAACAHGPEAVHATPDYAPITGDPAPPNARCYADCIGQAAGTGEFRRAADGGRDFLDGD